LCRSTRATYLFRVGAYRVYRCRGCTGGYVSPRPQFSEISGIYGEGYGEDYMGSVMHGESFAELRLPGVMSAIRAWHPVVLDKTPRRAFDVGCGSGHFLALLRNAGWEASGVEVSPGLASYARESLGLDVQQGEFLGADLPIGHFDLVTMFHIVEHFIDPITAVRKSFELLAPGGVLFVETPNWESIGARLRGSRWAHYIPPEHLIYLGPRSMKRLGAFCGLSMVMCRTTTPPVLGSLQPLPLPARRLGALLYRLASLLGYGPALLYMATRP
jgi:SAM-dependent methyltransferase